jgi:hypothetical protein
MRFRLGNVGHRMPDMSGIRIGGRPDRRAARPVCGLADRGAGELAAARLGKPAGRSAGGFPDGRAGGLAGAPVG